MGSRVMKQNKFYDYTRAIKISRLLVLHHELGLILDFRFIFRVYHFDFMSPWDKCSHMTSNYYTASGT